MSSAGGASDEIASDIGVGRITETSPGPAMNYKTSDVDGSWAVSALHETIKEFNDQSREQTAQMLKLTRWMACLTVAMLLGLLVQIYLELWPRNTATAGLDRASVTAATPAMGTVDPKKETINATAKAVSTTPSPTATASAVSK